MKIISFNYRGLAGALKKPALKRVIATEHPDVLLLQQTMGVGEEVKSSMELLLPGWKFFIVDTMGRSGSLATCWNTHNIQSINSWGLESGLGISVLAPNLKDVIHILNIYGPYQNMKPFWDSLLTKSFFKELLILGGDLNLSLGPLEVLGG
jgi:exonuclease III